MEALNAIVSVSRDTMRLWLRMFRPWKKWLVLKELSATGGLSASG